MPVNIRSFNVIIVMVGLSPHRADTMCREKAVCLHLPNHETLIIHGDKPGANPLPISCINGTEVPAPEELRFPHSCCGQDQRRGRHTGYSSSL